MPFNKQQNRAISAPVTSDILISAGAGSGKTKTLTEKVFTLIDSGEISPSQLLVLTFTNNAAHEMKTRIIKRFGNDSNAKEMLSSHVQTMDSFNQYLVTKYSARLGISSSISVADESIIKSKKNRLLDEVFDEAYLDQSEREKILKYLKHNALRDDGTLKNVVLEVYKSLETLLPNDKKQFLNNYENVFLSKEKLRECFDKLCNKIKDNLMLNLYKAYFICANFNSFYDEQAVLQYADSKVIHQIFENTDFFNRDYHYLDFDDDFKEVNSFYKDTLKVIDGDNDNFIGNYNHLFSSHTKRGSGKKEPFILRIMKGTLYGNRSNYEFIKFLPGSFEEHLKLVLDTKEDIKTILELTKKLDVKLADYKRTTNFFTFNDIALMALSLLTEDRYKDIADEIRSRFKFIMVDEYQDTNDFQETFINALLVPIKGQNSAHLFCVGDAKQAIYAFRNSNVELFRNRQHLYEESNDGTKEVIPMNNNYRSTERLLHDINYVFKSYMTLENGDIDYKDVKEQLMYDHEVNIYKDFKEGTGIYRLVPETFRYNKEDEKTIEILTIIKDIKDKIASQYKVFDRDIRQSEEQKAQGIYPQIRPCNYGDFAILLRNKSSFKLYQKLFNENGLPLNNKIGASLREVDSVIVLETLCNLLLYESGENKEADLKHLFASLARSYLYQYDDEALFELLDKPVKEIEKEPIMQKVHDFYLKNKNLSFKEIYLNLINEFDIVKKLYLVGNIDDNIAKIESLYNLILTTAKAGEGLSDFVKLFKDLKKYNLDIEDETVSSTSNAVDLMTIHASKGLERKIIYMPSSENKIARGKPSGTDLDFMKDYGIFIPNYNLSNLDEEQLAFNFLHYYYLNSDAKHINQDEHVRLLYVALTRAENTLIFVGNETSTKGSVYDIYENCPHLKFLNEELIERFSKPIEVSKDIKDSYLKLADISNKGRKIELDEEISSIYLEYFKLGLKGLISSLELDEYNSIKNIYYKDNYNVDRSKFKDLEVNGRKVDLFNIYNETFKVFHKDVAEEALWEIQRNFVDKIATFYLGYLYVLCNGENNDEKIIEVFRAFSSISEDIKVKKISEIDEKRKEIIKIISKKPFDIDDLIEEDSENIEVDTDENTSSLNEDFIFVSLDFNKVLQSSNAANSIKLQVENLLNYFSSIKESITSSNNKGIKPNEYALDLISKLAYCFDKIKVVIKLQLQTDDYEDRVTYYSSDSVCEGLKERNVPKLMRLNEDRINNSNIEFDVKVKHRASKLKLVDEDNDIEEILKRGVKLHRYMELVDFDTLDTSFIKDEKDRQLISRVLKYDLFKELKGSKVYKEYGYYDEDFNTTGFIDLLFVKNGIYTIVDYKTSDIYDLAYEDQMKTYRRNVMNVFKIDESKVKMYLISLEKGEMKEVK